MSEPIPVEMPSERNRKAQEAITHLLVAVGHLLEPDRGKAIDALLHAELAVIGMAQAAGGDCDAAREWAIRASIIAAKLGEAGARIFKKPPAGGSCRVPS